MERIDPVTKKCSVHKEGLKPQEGRIGNVVWGILHGYTNVLCSDGIQRYAKITGQADSFWTVPASVKVNGKTVTGFLMQRGNIGSEVQTFTPNQYGKNAGLLPNDFLTCIEQYDYKEK